MTFYKKELFRIFKSLLFIMAAIGLVMFANSQGIFPPESTITEPKDKNGAYGLKPSNDPALIMPEAAECLFQQFAINNYTTYPNGFMKYVKLNQADRTKMGKIITNLSNSSDDEITIGEDEVPFDFQIDPDITWEYFQELMTQADKLLGGGSQFSETWMNLTFGQIPITYEDALADYNLIVSKDQMTGAHARVFCDYMGLALGLIAVFPAVFLCMRDRKRIVSILYTRTISSTKFILSRFLALITAVMIPIFILGIILTCIHAADYGIGKIDLLAYFKYSLFWLLPTAMASTAIGLFLTTLTNTPIAVAVQLVWWFTDMMGGSGVYSFYGVRTFQLMPRHNAVGKTAVYLDYLPDLIQNRIWIALIALILVAMTILVFSAKRRGLLYVSLFKHSKI